ncbi:MAG: VWA domain-containing protein [Blastocatellia bacterium]
MELVVLYVTALNRRHLPVGGLGRADFRIYEDGVRQEIETFSHEDPPVTVGLVIDNSGSMRTKRTEVIAAAMAFARSSNPKDQLFLVNFNEHVTFGLPADRPFAGDLAQMEMALSTIGALGKTALYDAVAAALEHAKKGQTNKQALIVISDGADNASRYNAARVVALAKHSEAIIYTIGIFEADDPDRDPGSLRQLAKATGGESFLPDSERQATAICEGIARDIRSQYTISYMPTNTKRDGKYRAIQVRAAAPGGEHVYVRTRIGYYAPTKP